MPIERRRVFYSGRVQGVGFRWTAQRIAVNQPVAGHVRNLEDGRVELVVEGEVPDLDKFLSAIRNAMGAKIHDILVVPEPVGDPPYTGFSILD